jgi:putative proteasome-type protease
MTYCVALLVKEGLVMLADTRTNAGIDNVNVYRKLRVFGEPGKRIIGMASAGSLSTTQAAVNKLAEGVIPPGETKRRWLDNCATMFEAAQLTGVALAQSYAEIDATISQSAQADVSIRASMLVGGSINGAAPRLFLVYPEGNCIEAGMDTPYMQIGESKYGKPILDRLLNYRTPLAEALKIGLLSMNSAMRSNLAVGLPIDLLVLRPGQSVAAVHRIEDTDPYYQELGARWQRALKDAQSDIPLPPYALP